MVVNFRGFKACTCLAEWLPWYERMLLEAGVIKHNIDIYQLIGGAAASAGTHSTGGAFDIAQGTATALRIARDMGADATWRRRLNWDGRGGMAHTHGVLRGCPHNGPARYQIESTRYGVDHGHNGLANGGKDDGPKPLSKRSYKQGIAYAKAKLEPSFHIKVAEYVAVKPNVYGRRSAGLQGVPHTSGPHPVGFTFTSQGWTVTDEGLFIQAQNGEWFAGTSLDLVIKPKPVALHLRVGTFNLPDEEKLPNAKARVAIAAQQILDSKLDAVGLQELVGILGAGKPSAHAASLLEALGRGWALGIPTTKLNENYLLYRTAKLAVVKQYGDAIIRVTVDGKAVSGRHVTRFVLKDKSTGGTFAFGVTHLVNNNPLGAQAQAVQVGKTMSAVAAKHDKCPIVVTGDMNVTTPLGGLGQVGLIDCREEAAHTSTAAYDTFVTAKATRPTTSGKHRYDRIYATRGTTTNGANVVLANSFGKTRPSDHLLLIADLTIHA